MIIDKANTHANDVITMDGRPIERVHTFKYLGTCLNDDWNLGKDVKIRYETVRSTFKTPPVGI